MDTRRNGNVFDGLQSMATLTRRSFLQQTLGFAGLAALDTLGLAGCSAPDEAPSSSSSSSPSAHRSQLMSTTRIRPAATLMKTGIRSATMST